MTVPDPSAPGILEIRKYPNRRYYDSTHSRHLTLEEIRALVEQGYDIRVVDAKTKADITAQVLTQIILELDTTKLDSLPVPLLVRLIRVNDRLIKEFIEKYLHQGLKSFMDYQAEWEDQLRQTPGFTAGFPSVSDWTKAIWQPFAPAAPNAGTPPAPAPASGPEDNADLKELVRQLQGQVSDLQEKYARSGKPAARRRPKRPARRKPNK